MNTQNVATMSFTLPILCFAGFALFGAFIVICDKLEWGKKEEKINSDKKMAEYKKQFPA